MAPRKRQSAKKPDNLRYDQVTLCVQCPKCPGFCVLCGVEMAQKTAKQHEEETGHTVQVTVGGYAVEMRCGQLSVRYENPVNPDVTVTLHRTIGVPDSGLWPDCGVFHAAYGPGKRTSKAEFQPGHNWTWCLFQRTESAGPALRARRLPLHGKWTWDDEKSCVEALWVYIAEWVEGSLR